ncbi:MAG: outer membrane beta-barrel protein [Gammaproteobacteria bacterium]|nr:outer membrane beta-barrel protein [Gammaproteobacteria bacterium]MBV8306184.1 outer membrane beta-barrel protein [Gammaproteobacteria bacterium]MBV8404068.1 outer membrane beta-barrel protein [Gammaproteobacteria bacterium]
MRIIMLLVLAFAAGAAHAENGFFYIGAGVVRNSLSDITSIGGLPDLKNTSWKAYAGVRPIDWLAAEADYIDLGSNSGTNSTGSSGTTNGSAFAAYAVGFLPIPLPIVDVFGKAGLARWKYDGSLAPPGGLAAAFSTKGTDFAWGIGVQAHISMLGARLEYENFNVPNSSGARVASLSVFLNL